MLTSRSEIPSTYRPVVVTTDRRAIFGWLPPGGHSVGGGVSYVAGLLRSRTAIRWGRVGGVEGLAETGPARSGDVRVSVAADRDLLTGVISVLPCTPEAAERWESIAAVAT